VKVTIVYRRTKKEMPAAYEKWTTPCRGIAVKFLANPIRLEEASSWSPG
jgi:hypothetical protein